MTKDEAIEELKLLKFNFNTQVNGTAFCDEALEMAIQALSNSENPNKWIPVSERLPELHEADPFLKKFVNKVSDEVLVTIKDKKNGTKTVSSKCYLWDNIWHGDIFDWFKASKCEFEVTAWMPKPEPYKGD